MPLVRENSLLYEVIKVSTVDGNSLKVSTIDGDPLAVINGLSIPEHDYISLSYTGGNLTGVVYKTGGVSGTTVGTLTLAYDGSDNLISVTKS